MVKELRNQLKGQTLGDVSAEAFKQVGSTVYPDAPSIQDLAAFREIVDSFQRVHLPTLGKPIPQSTNAITVTQTSTEKDLLTASNNETLEVLAISTPNGTANGLSAGMLQIYNPQSATSVPFMDLPNLESVAEAFSGIIYGHVMLTDDGKGIAIAPSQLLLTGGESLSIKTKSAPDNPGSSINWDILYRKVMQ